MNLQRKVRYLLLHAFRSFQYVDVRIIFVIGPYDRHEPLAVGLQALETFRKPKTFPLKSRPFNSCPGIRSDHDGYELRRST